MTIQPHPLEDAVQETREWIKAVPERHDLNYIQACSALRGVLHAGSQSTWQEAA